MIREKKSEQQHYHSRDDYDHISSSSPSSWYIQLRNHRTLLTMSKSKRSFVESISLRSYLTIFLFVFLLFFISFSIFFSTEQTDAKLFRQHHRLKRQLPLASAQTHTNDKQHYTNMLRRILLHRTTSSVPADCTINMGSDGVYRLPSDNTLSSQIILLVERNYQQGVQALKRTAQKIRAKLNQSPHLLGDFALAKFRDDFSTSLRVLLASQVDIKELHIMIAPPVSNENNGGAYVYYDTIKYYRSNNSTTARNQIDYDSIHDLILKQNVNIILQTFTASNARETLKQNVNNYQLLMNDGWWIGPVLCERNRNETFMMAHIFPLTDR